MHSQRGYPPAALSLVTGAIARSPASGTRSAAPRPSGTSSAALPSVRRISRSCQPRRRRAKFFSELQLDGQGPSRSYSLRGAETFWYVLMSSPSAAAISRRCGPRRRSGSSSEWCSRLPASSQRMRRRSAGPFPVLRCGTRRASDWLAQRVPGVLRACEATPCSFSAFPANCHGVTGRSRPGVRPGGSVHHRRVPRVFPFEAKDRKDPE